MTDLVVDETLGVSDHFYLGASLMLNVGDVSMRAHRQVRVNSESPFDIDPRLEYTRKRPRHLGRQHAKFWGTQLSYLDHDVRVDNYCHDLQRFYVHCEENNILPESEIVSQVEYVLMARHELVCVRKSDYKQIPNSVSELLIQAGATGTTSTPRTELGKTIRYLRHTIKVVNQRINAVMMQCVDGVASRQNTLTHLHMKLYNARIALRTAWTHMSHLSDQHSRICAEAFERAHEESIRHRDWEQNAFIARCILDRNSQRDRLKRVAPRTLQERQHRLLLFHDELVARVQPAQSGRPVPPVQPRPHIAGTPVPVVHGWIDDDISEEEVVAAAHKSRSSAATAKSCVFWRSRPAGVVDCGTSDSSCETYSNECNRCGATSYSHATGDICPAVVISVNGAADDTWCRIFVPISEWVCQAWVH